ncbi:MazG-like family protein [Paenibacillus sp. OV219]|uniref:MazG-like family protein n=1 Tax=Paenibacillus sp. OV219 TaxID=1884377 RepID=UPI0008D70260|nr:MazG-like family protein [Paenibacillus sp. OV219]SEO75327.1 NTP pyrophosphatase, house-cleaning of non-canonical NTPs [Paenibacillus sp. OV219]
MNISELQQYVHGFSEAKGFDKSTIEQRMLFLMTEVGELSKEVLSISFHPEREQSENLGYEMFDIVWNLMDLANKLGIDLNQAFEAKMAINDKRSWEK